MGRLGRKGVLDWTAYDWFFERYTEGEARRIYGRYIVATMLNNERGYFVSSFVKLHRHRLFGASLANITISVSLGLLVLTLHDQIANVCRILY